MAWWRKMVVALLLLGACLACWTAWERKAAWRVYARVSAPEAPAGVQQVEDELQRQAQRLQARYPRLQVVEPRYLAQPLQETQALLISLAQEAFTERQQEDWRQLLELLGWMEVRERAALVPDWGLIHSLQQRLRALNGQARVMARWSPVQVRSPLPEWTSDQAVLARVLFHKRTRLWDNWRVDLLHPVALVFGFGDWQKARAQFEQLDRWTAEAARGSALSAPAPGLDLEQEYQRLK